MCTQAAARIEVALFRMGYEPLLSQASMLLIRGSRTEEVPLFRHNGTNSCCVPSHFKHQIDGKMQLSQGATMLRWVQCERGTMRVSGCDDVDAIWGIISHATPQAFSGNSK